MRTVERRTGERMIPAWGASPTEQRAINAVRILAMDAVEAAGSGHPGTPMGLATAGYALWSRFMSFDPTDTGWPNRDRFVMSNGHAGLLHYSLLHLTGFDLSLDDLRSFRQWGSKAAGHPERGVTPGVEVTTGPLGQGLGSGVGMAIAERMLASRFNRPGLEVVDHMTWVVAGDGDLMEGVASEAASLAGHLGLGRLVVLYDDNRITIEGSTSLTLSEDIDARFQSYGWHVVAASGNDLSEVAAAIHAAVDESSRPSLIRLRTSIGYGSPTKHDTAEAHGAPLGASEVAAARSALGWESGKPFDVPPEVYRHYRDVAARARLRRVEWDRTWSAYEASFPGEASELTRALPGRLPEGWDASLPSFESGSVIATRKASAMAINALARRVPELVGGSADLAPSTNTLISESGDVARLAFSGRNFHFGVREHAMGAILNGIAAHGGFRPFGATFLVFSDYMRPAIRLSALMGLPVIFVMTHDSVGLGEDGPTHSRLSNSLLFAPCPTLWSFALRTPMRRWPHGRLPSRARPGPRCSFCRARDCLLSTEPIRCRSPTARKLLDPEPMSRSSRRARRSPSRRKRLRSWTAGASRLEWCRCRRPIFLSRRRRRFETRSFRRMSRLSRSKPECRSDGSASRTSSLGSTVSELPPLVTLRSQSLASHRSGSPQRRHDS